MWNKQTVLAVAAAAALALALPASADTINGSFSVGGIFTPFLDGAESSLNEANELDFNDGTTNPGTPGTLTVSGTSGDFSGLLNNGDTGTIQDLQFAGAANSGFQAPTINGFEVIGGVSVDLLSIHVLQQTDSFLQLTGDTNINATGFDATSGSFSFVGPTNTTTSALVAQQSVFLFDAGNVAGQVPEPSVLLLCGIGLTLVAIFGRKRSKRR